MCVCVSLLKGLPQKDAKLRNIAAIRHIYAGHSVIACFVVLFFSFAEITKPQVERFVIFSILIGKLRNEVKTTKRAHYRSVTGHKKARPLRVTVMQRPGRVS